MIKTKTINVFGKDYLLTGEEIQNYESLLSILCSEEQDILNLKKKYDLEVREDLLILFIDMYFHRFSIPYFQITEQKFPSIKDEGFIREVLYYCMVGRAVDDIVDNDSKFFLKHESVIISDFYSKKLYKLVGESKYSFFQNYLVESAKYVSPMLNRALSFEDICQDVYIRIRYFFLQSENYSVKNQALLKTYMGVLLGGLDLNDSIADGFNIESSTVISNNLYNLFLNDEGKLLLNENLVSFFQKYKSIIQRETRILQKYLLENNLKYSANIFNQYLL